MEICVLGYNRSKAWGLGTWEKMQNPAPEPESGTLVPST